METVVQTLFSPSLYLTEEAVERQLELLKRSYSNTNMKAAEAASSSRLLSLTPMKHSSDSKLHALIGNNLHDKYAGFSHSNVSVSHYRWCCFLKFLS